MGSTLSQVVAKLNQTAFYPVLFQAAFGTPEITPERIGKAISQFERSMVSYNAKYDTAFAPGSTTPNFAAVFTQEERNGQAIFALNGRCNQCHTTSAHVSDGVHNVGLPGNTDPGAGNGKFKAPSLRNVEVRGAFMHDGRFTTLEQLVQFYNNGVQFSADLDPILMNATQTGPLRLNLTTTQRAELVAYLKTLTDTTFLTSPLFSDPFATLLGDFTGDGIVDDNDYNLATAEFGDVTSLQADGNGDLIVDAADYVLWRKFVGSTWLDLATSPEPGSSGGVPEPSGVALASILLGWRFTSRRRRTTLQCAAIDTG
jgi:cytochrome c peroxidase